MTARQPNLRWKPIAAGVVLAIIATMLFASFYPWLAVLAGLTLLAGGIAYAAWPPIGSWVKPKSLLITAAIACSLLFLVGLGLFRQGKPVPSDKDRIIGDNQAVPTKSSLGPRNFATADSVGDSPMRPVTSARPHDLMVETRSVVESVKTVKKSLDGIAGEATKRHKDEQKRREQEYEANQKLQVAREQEANERLQRNKDAKQQRKEAEERRTAEVAKRADDLDRDASLLFGQYTTDTTKLFVVAGLLETEYHAKVELRGDRVNIKDFDKLVSQKQWIPIINNLTEHKKPDIELNHYHIRNVLDTLHYSPSSGSNLGRVVAVLMPDKKVRIMRAKSSHNIADDSLTVQVIYLPMLHTFDKKRKLAWHGESNDLNVRHYKSREVIEGNAPFIPRHFAMLRDVYNIPDSFGFSLNYWNFGYGKTIVFLGRRDEANEKITSIEKTIHDRLNKLKIKLDVGDINEDAAFDELTACSDEVFKDIVKWASDPKRTE